MFNATEFISEVRIVPVVKLTDVRTTLPVMEALIAGNVPVAEITFRTDCAAEAIRLAAENLGEKMLVGAGTVIDARQAEAAIANGARFIVSPGYSEAVNGVCRANGVLYVPGAVTPTEIMQAYALSFSPLRFTAVPPRSRRSARLLAISNSCLRAESTPPISRISSRFRTSLPAAAVGWWRTS